MFRTVRVYITFLLFIVLILSFNIFFDYNYCIKGFDSFTLNYTKQKILNDVIQCRDSVVQKRVAQRGKFVVFENYIAAEKQFKCGESITLTAPGDYRFLDNVLPLVERWQGPTSIALYAPGSDFFITLQCIAYLRNCATPLVRKLVTFHLFFENEHVPSLNNSSLLNIYKDTFDCSLKPPYKIMKDSDMYKETHNLTYPINVARNIAKLAAQTHFVFPSDIELYPTRDFITQFFDFIRYHPENVEGNARKVFVLPIFEVVAGKDVPENKTQLQEMFGKKEAILFHQNVCMPCHKIPRQEEWINDTESQGLNVFHVAKRHEKQKIWEPFFVCTQKEPLWDERLNWEGQGNKMCQAYALCILDYDFMILDNAFLIHKPGVKKKKVQVVKHMDEIRKNNKMLVQIQAELQKIYGPNKKCKIHNVFKKK